MNDLALGALAVVLLVLAGLTVLAMAAANIAGQCRRDEFGRPGRTGPSPARDLRDLADGGRVPDVR
ncbi:hypothetical protein [Saccharothrix australiensis]|uniref:Uncharacterized protein n=1 Tax=Saccharothrix australiensis TaxID=2072 RepID=A0A495VK62_9PSEU|nr:hypothetical protein [Saccharothrix australiensis]RKT49290.1 hypothetical protein C8E97_6786 [Saccharothrix australiensis]